MNRSLKEKAEEKAYASSRLSADRKEAIWAEILELRDTMARIRASYPNWDRLDPMNYPAAWKKASQRRHDLAGKLDPPVSTVAARRAIFG